MGVGRAFIRNVPVSFAIQTKKVFGNIETEVRNDA